MPLNTVTAPVDAAPAAEDDQLARNLALAGGAGLLLAGLWRRTLPGVALALLGGGLLYRGVSRPRAIRVYKTITVACSPTTLYTFWRNLHNLPRLLSQLEKAQPVGARRSHWVARAPLGTNLAWDAEIVEDRPNERIAWQALPTSDVPNRGSVEFTALPDGRGTEIALTIEYDPPGGDLGVAVARMFGEAGDQLAAEALRHVKQLMEAGEIPTVQGQPSGRSAV